MALAQLALHLGQRTAHLGFVQPVTGDAVDGRQHPRFDFLGRVRIASVQAALKHQPAAGGLHPARCEQRRPIPRSIEQRLAKRRCALLQQAACEKPGTGHGHRIGRLSEPPRKRQAHPGRVSVRRTHHGVAHGGSDRGLERGYHNRLGRCRGSPLRRREPCECEFLQSRLQPLRPDGPGTQEYRVAGVVVPAVVGRERVVVEGRNLPWIATGVEPIRGGRKQATVHRLSKLLLGLAHQTAHLAQHHTAPYRRLVFPLRPLEFDSTPFLVEVQSFETRKEGRVEVHRKQVLEVGEATGREVVGGAVLGGERIHGGAQGAAQHRKERPPAGIALAAAHDQVFEDVGETARIRGRREEAHQEGAVFDRQLDVQVPRPGRPMEELRELGVERGHSRSTVTLEARWRHGMQSGGVRRVAHVTRGLAACRPRSATHDSGARRSRPPGRWRYDIFVTPVISRTAAVPSRHVRTLSIHGLSAAVARARTSEFGNEAPFGTRRAVWPPRTRCRRSRAALFR